MAGALASVLGLGAIAATYLVIRAANRSAQTTFRRIVSCPANEAMTGDVSQVVVGTVVALDDEMLIELRSARARRADRTSGEAVMWVHSPTNVTSIITLTRWRDSNAVVDARQQPHAVVLWTDQARVSLRSARADLAR